MALILSGTNGITDVNGTAAAPAITGTDTDTGVFFGTNTVSLSTGGTERLQVDASGNAGLGVTPSASTSNYRTLQIGSSGNSYSIFGQRVAGSSETFIGWNAYGGSNTTSYGSGFYYKNTGDLASLYTQNGLHAWFTAASGTAGNAITFTQAMTLDASGRLLVGGTTAPTGSAILLLNSNNGVQLATTVSGGGNITPISGGGLQFFNYTGAVGSESYSEKARIDSSGNLLVGTTSYSDGSMFYKPSNTALNCWRGTTTATDGIFGAFSNIGGTQTVRAYFRSDGGLANYSANNVNLSDENLKKDISLAGNYLAKICAIPVKNFRYKDQSESEDITLGVIAQDVLAVAPELVSQEGFGMDEESKQNYLSVYQTDLQYALMKAIQELKAIVDAQAAEIAALKGNA